MLLEAFEPAKLEILELTVTDLKQFAYCPRIPYYEYVLPVRHKKTYPMERGRSIQAAVEALEQRRGFRKYGLVGGERHFGLRVRSERLALSGRLDLLIRTNDAGYAVDFKDSTGPVRGNHRVQLAGYAILIEDALGIPVHTCFVYRIPKRDMIAVEIQAEDREIVEAALAEIRQSVLSEAMPKPTEVRNRCTACEFRNYCADIW